MMKKALLTLCLSLFVFSAAFAQDLESATNLYNSGAAALEQDNKTEALQFFEQALDQAVTIGAEAESIATNCKNVIPTIIMAIGKEQAAAKDLDNAIITLKNAIQKGEEYDQIDVVEEANALIPQILLAEGNEKLNAKDFTGAVAEYKKVIEFDPENGMAYLRLGMASSRTSDDATTISALENAAKFGQEANANKQLSTFFLKKAAAELKAKKYEAALEFGQKANAAVANPQALSICGKAAIALKNYPAAIEHFEAYLAASPTAKDANATMYQLAIALEATGAKDKACGYYKQIMDDTTFKEYATHKVKNELKCN